MVSDESPDADGEPDGWADPTDDPDGSPTVDGDGDADPDSTNPLQALYDPDGYFRARADDLSLARGVVVVLAAAVLGTAIFGGGLWLVTQEMTGTIAVDNPERPPDWVCEQDDPPEGFGDGCDEPAEVDRQVGALLWSLSGELLVFTFLGLCLLWPTWGIGLHVAALLANGSGSVRDSFVLGAWGVVPSAVSLLGGVMALWEALVGPDFSAASPETLGSKMTTAAQGVTQGQFGLAVIGFGLLVTAWQAYVWTYGLSHAHDVPERRAAVAAGGVALLAFVVGTVT